MPDNREGKSALVTTASHSGILIRGDARQAPFTVQPPRLVERAANELPSEWLSSRGLDA